MGSEMTSLRTLSNQDGAAILDRRSGTITTMNATGAYIWTALQQGVSVEAIAADLAHNNGEDLSSVQRDVTFFVEDLTERQLWSS